MTYMFSFQGYPENLLSEIISLNSICDQERSLGLTRDLYKDNTETAASRRPSRWLQVDTRPVAVHHRRHRCDFPDPDLRLIGCSAARSDSLEARRPDSWMIEWGLYHRGARRQRGEETCGAALRLISIAGEEWL